MFGLVFDRRAWENKLIKHTDNYNSRETFQALTAVAMKSTVFWGFEAVY